jgi:glycosyltransferase involved in cell wall biosynthesis
MAFNEARNLEVVAREIDFTLSELGQHYEIVIVDDGSSDGTDRIADRLAKEFTQVRVIHHGANQGLGGVYRTGFGQAQNRLITFFPADGQFPATIIKQFVPLMDKADVVLGYLPDRNSSLVARSLSEAEKVLYRMLLGPLPKFQGVLMFRRTLLDSMKLKSTGRGWAVLMELIIGASRGGYRLVSVPTEMRPRMSGKSKVNNLPTIWANLKQVIALRRYL